MSFIIVLIIGGLIVGALGRLAIPGPNPMSIPMTIAVGVGGMLIGGLIGRLLLGRPGGLILGVICAAGIVYLLQRSDIGRRGGIGGPRRDAF